MTNAKKLKIAKTGYKCAINALPYMPKESRPYTQKTADNYLSDIKMLEMNLETEHG